jgi:ABC-type antimicrobial peptide transport system permease subunit
VSSAFACIAIVLAAVGVYGVMAYQVAGRTSEIGTRIVLGARPGSVLWLVLRQSLRMVVAGFVVGVPLALVAGRALGAQLFGIDPWDPATVAAAMLSLVLAGVIAILIPAIRAVRVDPVVALRAE